QSALLKHTHRYGYQLEPAGGLVPLSDMRFRVDSVGKQRDKVLTKLYAFDGAIHEVSRAKEWMDDPAARLKWLQEQHEEHVKHLATLDGALQEAQFMVELATLRSRGVEAKIR